MCACLHIIWTKLLLICAVYSLANLFNAIPRTSPARLVVCNALLRLAAANDELDTLHLSAADVNRWLSEWGVSSEEKSNFLKAVSDAFLDSGNLCVEVTRLPIIPSY